MEKWAAWALDRGNPTGWPRTTVLGKLLDGMPSTQCVACGGSGRVPIEGEANGVAMVYEDCSVCCGTGKVSADPHGVRVNPAFISSTKPGGYIPDDSASERIDWLICNVLNDSQRAVVMHEYCWSRNKNEALKKLRITHRQYRLMHHMSLRIIEANLTEEDTAERRAKGRPWKGQ